MLIFIVTRAQGKVHPMITSIVFIAFIAYPVSNMWKGLSSFQWTLSIVHSSPLPMIVAEGGLPMSV